MRYEFEFAGLGIRIAAGLVDFFILTFPATFLIFLLTGEMTLDWTQGLTWNIVYALYLTILPVIWRGYIVGKRIFKIKVKSMDGKQITLLQMFIRECIGKIMLGYLTFGITSIVSALMVYLRKDKRAIHDLLAGTFVSNEL